MSASDTPRTDAVAIDEREGITHPELCDTYMAWTNYWALRELARQLERELAAERAKLESLERSIAGLSHPNMRMLLAEHDALRHDVDKLFAMSNELAEENSALRADAERMKNADVLAAYKPDFGEHRQWWSGGTWLYPGDEVLIVSLGRAK